MKTTDILKTKIKNYIALLMSDIAVLIILSIVLPIHVNIILIILIVFLIILPLIFFMFVCISNLYDSIVLLQHLNFYKKQDEYDRID